MAKVLIVDDSLIMRKNLKTILSQGGHTVIGEATNGLQACKEYERLNPDVVTMDITMPVMDGIKSVEKIINSFPDAKIIMISSLDQKKMVFDALKAGAKHYIMKPITSDKILTVLREVLSFDRLEDYSKDLGSESEALDTMWYEIKESKDQVFELNKTLEQKIEERTFELEEMNHKLQDTVEELKNTQNKLIQSEKNAALSSMIAGISHEINTPVGICITAVSYIHERTQEMEEAYNSGKVKKSDFESYLKLINETSSSILLNLNKASDLIRSFKQVAVDQSSKEKRVFNIKSYLKDILLSLKPELKKRPHRISVNCDDNVELFSYPGAFSQIITNLIMNTLIHGYSEGEEVHINININKDNDSLLIEYSDEGRGIPKDIQDRIFDAFFTTRRGTGGTGLGLNIIYNLILQTLKGTIRCESEEDFGTAFIINIPMNQTI